MRPGLNTWVWRHSYFGSMCGAKETRHRQSQEVLNNSFPLSVFHASYILLCHVCLDLYLDMNWNVTSCWHLESWVFCYVLLSPCLLCYILFCLMLLGCHACSPFLALSGSSNFRDAATASCPRQYLNRIVNNPPVMRTYNCRDGYMGWYDVYLFHCIIYI